MKTSRVFPYVFPLLLLALGVCLPAWPQEPPDAPPPPAEEGAAEDETSGPESGNGTNPLAKFVAGQLSDFIKSGNVFFPGPMDEGGDEGEPEEDDTVTLNFNNADMNQVLQFVSKDVLGLPIIKSDEVNGNITLMMPEPVSKEEALRKIETAMALKNFTLVETDGMLLALTIEQALKAGIRPGEGEVDPLSSRIQTRVIQLEHADATRIKETVASLLTDENRIIAEPRTNQLIITDTGVNIARVSDIVKKLDREDEGTRIITEIIKLNYASADRMQRALEDLLNHLNSGGVGGSPRDRRNNPGSSGLTTQVFDDPTTNSLIISGPAPQVEMVKEFIAEMDKSASEGMVDQTFKLQYSSASALAMELNQLMQAKRSGFRQPVIVADSWTNSLLVTGFPEDIAFVSDMIGELDRIKTSERDTQVFVLEHADAAVLSEAITQVLGEEDSGSSRSYYSYYSNRGRGGDQDDSAIKIYEDLRLNALIISARVQDFPMIEELVKALDVGLDEGKEEPRVFNLEYADATALSQILEDLFEDDTNNYYSFFGGGNQKSSISSLAGKVRIIADPTTNSLIVISSTPRAFDIVEGLLKDLDRVATFGSTFVVTLKNANANELAEYLNVLFEEDNQGGGGGGRGVFWFLSSALGGEREISNLIGNVRIVAEPRTNALLITTQQQNFESIKELIDKLDEATAQVLVEILIVEMSAVEDNDLGIQWGVVNNRVGQTGINTGSVGNIQNFGTVSPSPLGLDWPSVPGAPFNRWNYAALSSAQFGVVLNYLKSDGTANVVARPNIMTSNNEPAVVRLVQEIPFVNDVNVTNNSTNFSVEYKDVGLVLSVTPQINVAQVEEEKRVTLDVTLRNGELNDNIQTVSVEGTKLQAFSTREVNTHVTVSNAMTVVLSGVLDEALVESRDGVPGLSRIPLMGRLFRNKSMRKEKTELLTFITPYILTSPEDLERVTRQQMDTDAYRYYLEEHGMAPPDVVRATGPVVVPLDRDRDDGTERERGRSRRSRSRRGR